MIWGTHTAQADPGKFVGTLSGGFYLMLVMMIFRLVRLYYFIIKSTGTL